MHEILAMTRIDLPRKAILVTGSLGAIAEHLVRRLSGAGAFLVLTDVRSGTEAESILRNWNIDSSRYLYLPVDVTISAEVESAVNEVMNRFPRPDTVLGHAGGCGLHPFIETSTAEFERIFRFNYLAQSSSPMRLSANGRPARSQAT